MRSGRKNLVRGGLAGVLALVASTAASTTSRSAHADDPKRPVPDYDGRPPAPATPGEVALWVPRVLFFPPYLVSEYFIRRPLGALITAAERGNWATTLVNVFTFGPEHKAGVVPTAFLDFGMLPSVGLYFFWDDAFANANDVRAHVSYFGSSWLALALTDRVHLGGASTFSLDGAFLRRPDNLYYGEGANAPKSALSRYLADKLDVAASFVVKPSPYFSFDAHVGLRVMSFSDREFHGQPSIDEQVAAGVFAPPTGYDTGYASAYQRAGVVLDSRRKEGSGARLTAYGEHASDVRAAAGSSWFKYGGAIGGYLDVYGQRVFGLSVDVDFASPTRGSNIPFTEEVTWGGTEPMSGFRSGRFHGRSAAAAKLSYSWPIWVWLSGTMHAAVGNVFDAGLRDFEPKLLRLSSGIGVHSNGSPDHRFEILFGIGTETFENGAKVESFRFVVGGTNGF